MAVVGTAGRGIIIYTLEQQPKEYKRETSPLKYQHRCISIFRDKKAQPTGKLLQDIYRSGSDYITLSRLQFHINPYIISFLN